MKPGFSCLLTNFPLRQKPQRVEQLHPPTGPTPPACYRRGTGDEPLQYLHSPQSCFLYWFHTWVKCTEAVCVCGFVNVSLWYQHKPSLPFTCILKKGSLDLLINIPHYHLKQSNKSVYSLTTYLTTSKKAPGYFGSVSSCVIESLGHAPRFKKISSAGFDQH